MSAQKVAQDDAHDVGRDAVRGEDVRQIGGVEHLSHSAYTHTTHVKEVDN